MSKAGNRFKLNAGITPNMARPRDVMPRIAPSFTPDDMYWIKAELQKGRPFALVLCDLFYHKDEGYKQQIDEYSLQYWQEFTKGIKQ